MRGGYTIFDTISFTERVAILDVGEMAEDVVAPIIGLQAQARILDAHAHRAMAESYMTNLDESEAAIVPARCDAALAAPASAAATTTRRSGSRS